MSKGEAGPFREYCAPRGRPGRNVGPDRCGSYARACPISIEACTGGVINALILTAKP